MNLKQALQRIEELERKVKELEARPAQQTHIHYHNQPPFYQPILPHPITPAPWIPAPWQPNYYEVTCAAPLMPNGIAGTIEFGGGRQQ